MTSFEQMLKDSEARIMTRLDKIEAKVDEVSDFRSGLQGAAKIGMAIVVILGTAVAIYAAIHGLHPGATK